MTYFLPGAFLTRWVGKHRPVTVLPCRKSLRLVRACRSRFSPAGLRSSFDAPQTAVGTAVADGVLPRGSAAAHCRRPRVQDTSTACRRPKFPPAQPDPGGDCLLAVGTATR